MFLAKTSQKASQIQGKGEICSTSSWEEQENHTAKGMDLGEQWTGAIWATQHPNDSCHLPLAKLLPTDLCWKEVNQAAIFVPHSLLQCLLLTDLRFILEARGSYWMFLRKQSDQMKMDLNKDFPDTQGASTFAWQSRRQDWGESIQDSRNKTYKVPEMWKDDVVKNYRRPLLVAYN